MIGESLRLGHLGTWARPLERDVCVEEVAMGVGPFSDWRGSGTQGAGVSPVLLDPLFGAPSLRVSAFKGLTVL